MLRLACLASLLAACSLYTGGGDDTCQPTGIDVPADVLRNPDNGTCTSVTQPYCDPSCEPCPGTNGGTAGGGALADWASCLGSCESLSETACLAAASCHAGYVYSGNGQQTPTFLGCWDLPPSGAVTGGDCTVLDAQDCSEHTDCISTYDGYLAPSTENTFDHCAPEPGSTLPPCEGTLCPDGEICALQGASGGSGSGSGYTPVCVTEADAGSCSGAVACDIALLPCPSGTTRGILGACYSQYCIPNDECQLPACSTLTTQAACQMRTDCDAIFDGAGCTCDNSGCTCTTETFDHCQ
jgi:hypothetical protein